MAFLSRLAGGVVALLRRSRHDKELDAELQAFLEPLARPRRDDEPRMQVEAIPPHMAGAE